MCSPTPSASVGQPPFTTHHITTNLYGSSIHPAISDSACTIHHTCTGLHNCASSNDYSDASSTPATTCTSLHCCASNTTCNDLHTGHVCQVIPTCDLTGTLSHQR